MEKRLQKLLLLGQMGIVTWPRNSPGSTHQSDMGCGTRCCFSILASEFKVYHTREAGALRTGLSLFSVTEGCRQETLDHLHEDKFQYWTQINSFSHSSFARLVQSSKSFSFTWGDLCSEVLSLSFG